nr:PREDICTED: SPARC-related modular calcium-binding protein 1-like [Equus przewalskii]
MSTLASDHKEANRSGADGSCRILSSVLWGRGVCLWPRFSEPDPSHTLEERVVHFSEPDPSHTLEERVVHWYFSQLDSNSSNDINKREMKPFKRYVKKKAKPKKCARRFTDYCDLNKDKVISLPELKGCLGVSKEGRLV